jgi:predicted nuclease with TOPRIM domain
MTEFSKEAKQLMQKELENMLVKIGVKSMTDRESLVYRLNDLRERLTQIEADIRLEQDVEELRILEGEADILMDIIKLREAQLRKLH